jgi:xylulokinase
LASRTLGFDIQKSAWDSDLLQFTGISEQQLSRVESSGKAIGTASARIARELGLSTDVVWCTAGHDQACASIGAGALGAGTIADGTGTFECASIPLKKALVSPTSLEANLPCECHVIPDQFLTLAYVPGGIALKWLRDNFVHVQDNSYDTILAGLPIEPTGIFCFPYFLGTGTPWLDSQAKGAMYGLTSSTTRQSLVQAMLEGISYEMRWNLEVLHGMGIEIKEVFAAGGGAKSEAWLQLKSDIFGCPIVQVPGEASSRGAAICAAMAVGKFRNWDEAVSAMVKGGRIFEPRPSVQPRYQELFEQYKEIAHRLYSFKSPRRPN